MLLALLNGEMPSTLNQMDSLEKKLAALCKREPVPAHYFYLWAWLKQKWYHEWFPRYMELSPSFADLLKHAEVARFVPDKAQELTRLAPIDGMTLAQIEHRMNA
jgi:hypothetical protein